MLKGIVEWLKLLFYCLDFECLKINRKLKCYEVWVYCFNVVD